MLSADDLPVTAGLVAHLQVVASAGSTNADLVAAALAHPEDRPAPALLLTDHQTAGRGRLGRAWAAAPGDSLAISLLLRPALPRHRLGWLSLAAGAAMAASLQDLGVAARAKWPNDVLVGGRKVCGVLAEAMPDGGVVIGAGLNHAAGPGAVPTATSVAAEGGPSDPDVLVSGYLRRLLALVDDLVAADGDPDPSGVRGAVLAVSDTVGRRVRVTLPDGSAVTGEAVGIDVEGRIEVARAPILRPSAIAAGDVEHLRYE